MFVPRAVRKRSALVSSLALPPPDSPAETLASPALPTPVLQPSALGPPSGGGFTPGPISSPLTQSAPSPKASVTSQIAVSATSIVVEPLPSPNSSATSQTASSAASIAVEPEPRDSAGGPASDDDTSLAADIHEDEGHVFEARGAELLSFLG